MPGSREYQSNWHRTKRLERIAAGLCTSCGKEPAEEGIRECAGCREKLRAKGVRWRERHPQAERIQHERKMDKRWARIEAGKCARCSSPHEPGLTCCRPCLDKQAEEYRQAMRDPARREKIVDSNRRRRLNFRLEVFGQYGGRCACCGEDRHQFLALDHINGNGNEERRKTGRNGGQAFYRWLRSQGYPSGYQVLCHNCNMSYGMFSACPHKEAA